jgi:protein arginine kinase
MVKERIEHLEDKVGRAYGLLSHARVMSSEEAVRLLSDLRLGISLGMIDFIPASLVNELMVAIKPAFLVKIAGKELTPFARDVNRADLIRKHLSQRYKC